MQMTKFASVKFKKMFHPCHIVLKIQRPEGRYRISSVISFFSFQNNPKDLDPSYKTDLDLWDCLGRVKLVL